MSEDRQQGLEKVLSAAPVIPVLTIETLDDAVPLARALVKGGLAVLEITLRTKAALECIRAIVAEVDGAIVGAGTVLDGKKLKEAEHLGCAFAVSPGATRHLLEAAEDVMTPLLPGSATASECMALMERGYRFQKFFPAEAAGGAAYLGSLAAPLPQVMFCPTGGITPEIATKYLKLANVITIGGSWMATKKLVAAKNWAGIEALAREASKLRAPAP
ncbi:MAG: bifunctional 4-hydroxy-2-oxoglutarate aldolase/2-dehydro-3-deoxy-phosphogluconate aldolase [Rhizobiales bacterium]|nr:bifunctional 4-hydroxy-2-oxoglutarate aldolase/2-dehydro-3-deoxy-phosphogluconate aldolase [Hyphomicrobiales bacterium]MBI3672746.1 bifunctional 4-hydroxy-2-oxoglutarate aldolase/2-dehydro-3-deoxy-phosphogluconate aldolase [Hyphomicrobiales bacterium]